MSDNLRDRIAAALSMNVKDQMDKRSEHFDVYAEMDDDDNPTGRILNRVDGSINPFAVADAVIAELQPELKSLDRLAQWQAAPRLPMYTQNAAWKARLPWPTRKADDE